MLNKTMNKAACILSDVGIDPTKGFDIFKIKEAIILKLLVEGKPSSKKAYKAYRFLFRKCDAINRNISNEKWINVCKKYSLKPKPVLETGDFSLLTDFFTKDPMMISFEDGKIVEEVIDYNKQKEATSSNKEYKSYRKNKVTYIFEKEYYKSVSKKNLDINKAVAFYEDYHDAWDNKYVYFIHLNEQAGSSKAVSDVIKRQITLIICYAIIMMVVIQNAINTANH